MTKRGEGVTIHTITSPIELMLRPSGVKMPLTASMFVKMQRSGVGQERGT